MTNDQIPMTKKTEVGQAVPSVLNLTMFVKELVIVTLRTSEIIA
jgi:hypothetical protein